MVKPKVMADTVVAEESVTCALVELIKTKSAEVGTPEGDQLALVPQLPVPPTQSLVNDTAFTLIKGTISNKTMAIYINNKIKRCYVQ